LLNLSKAELEEFARKNKIPFREDPTNFSSDFLRNRIRNKLLPLLKKNYQFGLNKTVLRLMDIVGAESEFVGAAAAIQKSDFGKLPVAIQRRVLQSQLEQLNVATDFELVEQLRETAGKFVSISALALAYQFHAMLAAN
jgi:tRNA(Ile)-lysidine synthase